MISNLQQGRLFVREDLLQPQQLSGLPLRQTCLDTLAKEQGSIITVSGTGSIITWKNLVSL